MIKAIVFDCFGVLTEDGWLAFTKKYADESVIDELKDINRRADRGEVDYDTFLSTACSLTGAPKHVAHTMITAVHHPDEAVFAYIRQLKEAGYGLQVLSNVGSPLNQFLPKEYLALFDSQILSFEVGSLKPEPDIYWAGLARLAVEPNEAVFIDDRQGNVAGAEAVGMHGVVYLNVEDLKVRLSALGVHI